MRKIKLTEGQIKRILENIIKEQSDFFENPFKNKLQGDAFRGWVNNTFPDFAKEIKLNTSGKFNNSFINKALKQPIKLSNGKTTTMMDWYMSKNPNWATGNVETKKKTEKPTPPKKEGGKKVTQKVNPKDINDYPKCIRAFGEPVKMELGFIDKFLGNSPAATYAVIGKRFYEGYFFTVDGKYILSKDKKKTSGTYSCQKGKLMLDIASKANEKSATTSGKYKYSPRIDAEVKHIQNRGLDKSPFFIYDPKDNLIYLFDMGSKYIDSTSVVDGADAQKSLGDAKAFTIDDWCKVSNLGNTPHRCTNPKTKQKVDPYYGPLTSISARFLPKGIYTIKGLELHKGYSGGASGNNTWSLKPIKLEGTITAAATKGISAALHGIPNLPDRLSASKELQQKLQSDINGGKVPKEYLQSTKAILNANQSFGCIGLPASFVDSPKVQSILKKGNVSVFAMGEGSDMLVKNDQPKTGETNVA
jgi:hypothetical protein